MPVRFLAAGEVMVDLTITGSGHDATVEMRPGGTALIAATWASALGAEATVAGRIGEDFAGTSLRAYLDRLGIRAELVVDPSLATGTFARVDCELRVDRGANAGAWGSPQIPEADVALVSGYLDQPVVEALLAVVRAPWVALVAGRLRTLPAGSGVVVANAGEAYALTGERNPAAAARRLATGDRLACVTLGPDGVVAARNGALHAATPPERHVGVASGAGDAFAAGLMLELAGGSDIGAALRAGCEAGARQASSGSPF